MWCVGSVLVVLGVLIFYIAGNLFRLKGSGDE